MSDLLSPIGHLPEGWKLEKLIDLSIKIGSGSTPRGGESAYLPTRVEYAFVRSQNVFDFHFSPNEMKFISGKDAEKLKGVHLEKEDILLNITGDGVTFARTCIVPEEILPAAVNQHVSIIRLDQKKCLPGYLLAYFCLPQIKDYIANFNAGGSRRAITKGHIESFEIPLAPVHVQEYVQKVTYDFIDKIQLNRQTNQTLEQIAQAIFKSWFVDFEPTRAKIAAIQNGQDPELAAMCTISGTPFDNPAQAKAQLAQKTPAQLEQLKATAELFPEALVESELGEIPEGWETVPNGSVMDVRDGTHDSPKQSETGFPLVTSKHITTGALVTKDAYLISKEDYEKINKRSEVNQNDILLTMIGTVGIPYLVAQKDVNFAIKNIGLFRTSDNQELKNYFYLLLKSSQMQLYLDARIAGTTQKYLSLKTLRSIEMILPSKKVLAAFNFVVNPLMGKIFNGLAENTDLANIRDTLLPKLLSGELIIAPQSNSQKQESSCA